VNIVVKYELSVLFAGDTYTPLSM